MELYADIGIVVARPEECAAVRCVFGATLVERPTRSDPNYYYESDLSTEAGTYRIIVVQAPKMGNSGAAIVATNLIQKYRVKHVIMVGIAAGIPNLRNEAKHVRLGDVVASYGDGVVQYDLGKRHPGGRFEIRSKMPLPSRLLTGAADKLKSDLLCGGQAPWLKYIAQAEPLGRKPPEESDKLEILTGKNKLRWKRVEHPQSAGPRESPRIHLGLIGSGTCLQKDIVERDRLAAETGIIALEMEGAGVADASWNQSETGDYFIVRGISDYADRNKNDEWHQYAAIVAAAYARALIDAGPFPPRERKEIQARTSQTTFLPELRAHLELYLDWMRRTTSVLVFRESEMRKTISLEEAFAPLSLSREPIGVVGGALPNGEEVPPVDLMSLWPSDEFGTTARQSISPPIIQAKDLLGLNSNLIIIGPPGSGKTTILQLLAHIACAAQEMETGKAEALFGVAGEIPVPVYIPLNAFAHFVFDEKSAIDSARRTLWDFAEYYPQLRQAPFKVPEGFFNRLLAAGLTIMLLLDGLDEVVDPAHRRWVTQAIEDATKTRYQVRCIVTCRKQVYLQSLALYEPSEVFRLRALDPEEVESYIKTVCGFLMPHPEEAAERAKLIFRGISASDKQRQSVGLSSGRLFETILTVRVAIAVYMKFRRIERQRGNLLRSYITSILESDYSHDASVSLRLASAGGGTEIQMRILAAIAFRLHAAGDDDVRNDDTLIAAVNQCLAGYLPAVGAGFARLWVQLVRQRGGILEFRDGKFQMVHLVIQELLAGEFVARRVRESVGNDKGICEQEFFFNPRWREPLVNCIESCIERQALNRVWAHLATAASERLAEGRPGAINCLSALTRALIEYEVKDFDRPALTSWIQKALFSDYAWCETAMDRAELGRLLGAVGDARLEVTGRIPQIVKIAGGEFQMGQEEKGTLSDLPSAQSGTYPVRLAAYAIGQYPVTNAQFAEFLVDGGYAEKNRDLWTKHGWAWRTANKVEHPAYWRDPYWCIANHPVVGVSWFEALAYAGWLSRLSGRFFRLPSEAEWERAATGRGLWPWGNQRHGILANTEDARIARTCCVGLFPGTQSLAGVSEMSGNVWEWCNSLYRTFDRYVSDDGRELVESGELRAIRGGSWLNNLDRARITNRDYYPPGDRHYDLGFRIAESTARRRTKPQIPIISAGQLPEP